MNTNALLDLLEKDARLTVTDLADMLEEEEDTVRAEVKRLENDKIICGYHTVINYNRGLKDEKVMAFIEVDCRPTRDRGYDKTARLIASYPEVSTMYLLSGDCDFLCLVEGKTMFEVARFVYDKISAVEDVTSTKTLFVLKEYKKNGIMMKDEDEKKKRQIGGDTMTKPINHTVREMKPSGIRKFFDLASTMEGVISLGVGEPDFATPWHICESAIDSMIDGNTHYTANRGLIQLREEIARFHEERYGQIYDPEKEIIVTVGGSEGVDLTMRTLVDPGDEVIVLDPNYVAYAPAIELAGGTAVPIRITKEHEFKLLPEDLAAAITDRTKAIILNFPSNPTGGVMTAEDYAKLVPILKESGIYVISDEIYAELLFDGEFASLAQFPEIRDQVIVINGFSKAFAMTGWRLGYLLAPAALSSMMNKVHQYVIMAAPTPAQYAAIQALKEGIPDIEAMREDYRRRRNLLVRRLNRMGLPTIMPHGTFYVFPDITSTGLSSEEFCAALLDSQKVACVPGTAFGESGEGHIRISYAYSLDHIKEACDRMEQFLGELRPTDARMADTADIEEE